MEADSPASSGPGPRGGAGRFETRYAGEDLLRGVRHVLADELGLALGEHLGQRPFDRAAEGCEHLPDFPSARQIATRLRQSWEGVVRTAWQVDPDVASYEGAAMHAEREPERELDDRDTVAALGTVARHLDVDTLTPGSYETGREALLAQARRDGTLEHWRELLPTAHQVTQANERSWDFALAKAGLRPRPGAELSKAAWKRVRAARRALGLPVEAPHDEPETDAPPTVAELEEIFGPSPASAPSAEPETAVQPEDPQPAESSEPPPDLRPSVDAEAAPTVDQPELDDEPLIITGPRRGGNTSSREALSPTDAVVAFVRHQGAWPSSRGALDDWSAHYGVAVSKLSGPLDAVLDAAAAALEAADEPAPSRRFMLTGRQLDLTLPAPEGDDRTAVLQAPAQHDLRRRLVVRVSDAGDRRILERAGVAAVAVERDPADRRPRLGEDVVLLAEGLHVGLGEVRVLLDLVDRRHDRGVLEQPGEMVDHEVADADCPHLAVGQQRLQRAVCLERAVEGGGQRLVEDQEVDLLDAELAGTLLEPVQRLVVAVVGDPDLRLQEHVRAVQARGTERLAHLALVPVGGGGVDVAVAVAQRGLDGGSGLLGRALEDAEPERGHRHAVAERQGRGNCRSHNQGPLGGG